MPLVPVPRSRQTQNVITYHRSQPLFRDLSPLGAGVGQRLAAVSLALVLLWLAVLWAIL
jgi:hypothetical protein